jgi:nucleoside-diphosphate-sugar epimerase
MRLMVIGATGFIGRQVRRQAARSGLTVITAGRGERGEPGDPGCHWRVDLAADGPARIAEVLARAAPDAVVNCAGLTAGTPEQLAAANVTGAWALARAMHLARIPARLVHLGSAAEYGPGPDGQPAAESQPPRPVTVYGATKLAGTQLVGLARLTGLPAVVLRVFNPVGPGAPERVLAGRLAGLLRRSPPGSEVHLGPLDAVRDFVDVRDVADAVLAAVTVPVLPRPVINIGSGRGTPVRHLVTGLLAVSGSRCAVREDAPGSPRSAGQGWQQADIRRAAQDLGWRPRRDLATSLADLWEVSRDLDLRRG